VLGSKIFITEKITESVAARSAAADDTSATIAGLLVSELKSSYRRTAYKPSRAK
jgi:hypothetical protein